MITRIAKIVFYFCLVASNLAICIYHIGVFPKPMPSSLLPSGHASALWIGKEKFGMHQLILSGSDYERGLNFGKLTSALMRDQETVLVGKFRELIPNDFVTQVATLFAITWFKGIEKYFEPWITDEMYGVSLSASADYNYLIDPFTRQIAYHGLHEVGQLMVDQAGENMGCTVVAFPLQDSWILGRNFDFEGGRIFDREKILKWVFPEQGNSYVSVTWAGMVGAVTGINKSGLYISINAAGSKDFRRQGTPSTLVLLKALQFSTNADEALKIIRDETVFITDIFVVFDSKANRLYRIEKSPLRTEIIPLADASIVTNHLLADSFSNDLTNVFRRDELTSGARTVRGLNLIAAMAPEILHATNEKAETLVLSVLRDKGVDQSGRPLHLGNRRAIDALIATHSVIYNAHNQILFVGQGPSVAGAFTGFDLAASFASRKPIEVRRLPRDPLVSDQTYRLVHMSWDLLAHARSFLRQKNCAQARPLIAAAGSAFEQQSMYYSLLGDLNACENQPARAKLAWQKALELSPAYAEDERHLRKKWAQ